MALATTAIRRCLAYVVPLMLYVAPSFSLIAPCAYSSSHLRKRVTQEPPRLMLPNSKQKSTFIGSALQSSKAAQGEDQNEMERFIGGWNDMVTGKAWDASNMSQLWTSPEDVVGIFSMVPLIFESLRTAVTGTVSPDFYVICSVSALSAALAHGKMYWDSTRDYRAPRLAEYKTIYEYSAVFNVAFAWLLLRLVPSNSFISLVETLTFPSCLLLSGITLYGLCYAGYGKKLLEDANDSESDEAYTGPLLPSDADYQGQAQLYLSGNIVLNVLACLFLPITWTVLFRGTEWWERVLSLHPNEEAFLGISVLVALIGNISGTLLLRLQELGIFKSQRAIVVVGVVSNILLLLFPEIMFQVLYKDGISEIGFYWE